MRMLKAYFDERAKYPRERKIMIRPEYRILLVEKLCKRFTIENVRVDLKLRRPLSGRAWPSEYRPVIALPAPRHNVSLGTVYHEIAHLFNYAKWKGTGHTGTFWEALHSVYAFSKPELPRIFQEIRAELANRKIETSKALARIQKQAERKQVTKELKKTSAYKIEHLQKRIKKLESRKKRIETLLKSARRSLVYLQRYQTIKQQKDTPKIENEEVV